jgi:hypothetical protein
VEGCRGKTKREGRRGKTKKRENSDSLACNHFFLRHTFGSVHATVSITLGTVEATIKTRTDLYRNNDSGESAFHK